MSEYERQLIAFGIDPEQAARDAWVNDVLRLQNHEHPNYGKQDDEET